MVYRSSRLPSCSSTAPARAWSRALAVCLSLVAVGLAQTAVAQAERVLYVDASHVAASDAGTGAASRPLATISEALERAVANRASGAATRIIVQPGTYREALVGSYPPSEPDAPWVVVEAAVPGEAVVSGSDVWTDWECDANVCIHDWPFDWGFADIPWSHIHIEPLGLRREMVFVDGSFIEQRLELSDAIATPATFHVDEEGNRLTLHLPPGADSDQAVIEVAVRPWLVRLQGFGNLEVRGLVFEHGNPAIPETAVTIVDQTNVLVEDVIVRWSNWTGIAFTGTNLVLRRSTITHNGASGISAYRVSGLLLEGNESSNNNWRGYAGGFVDWAVGDKFMFTRDLVIRDQYATSNLARGLWIDYDNVGVVIERLVSCGNLTDGLFIEQNPGKVSVVDSTLCDNGGAGVRTSATNGLELRGNVIEGNQAGQIVISGDLDVELTDWITGQTFVLNNESWSVVDNVLRARGQQLLVATTLPRSYWYALMATADFNHNEYALASDGGGFQIYGGSVVDFSDWQSRALQDSKSTILRIE